MSVCECLLACVCVRALVCAFCSPARRCGLEASAAGLPIACAANGCPQFYNVSGAESRYPETMGVYMARTSFAFGGRPQYEGPALGGDLMAYLYYWPETRQWLIGPKTSPAGQAVIASATLEATCPDEAPRWLVAAGAAGWVSTDTVAVVPWLGAGRTFSPTQRTSAAPTSVGSTPQRSGHLLRLRGTGFGVQGPSVACEHAAFFVRLGRCVAGFLRAPAGASTESLGSAKSRRHHLVFPVQAMCRRSRSGRGAGAAQPTASARRAASARTWVRS
jgi:hypothetical protein